MNIQQLENELWEAADQLRANSKLTAAEYSMPVLGLIFLRHADNRFKAYLPDIEADIPSQVPAAQREELIKLGFQGKAAIYLPEEARFDRIASLPQGANVGAAIDAAMDAIEVDYEVLKGALPRGYTAFEPDLLAELVKIFDRPAIKAATGDVFGRIYEYFLNKFAQSGAQEGGEFFTPPSLVRTIVNVIEPDHGLVLDPACGSAGMFVQTGHFIEDVRHKAANDLVTFHGQEKSDTNTKLARMNLVVHGLDASNIRQGNTFYDQAEHLIGQCDFVMANPPFNVDGVDTKKVAGQVDPAGRLPFGLPGTNAKTGAISNANSLWIQYFYSYLNDTGRAGFVMASSASDAGNKDRDIREQLVKSGHVDVMVAIGNKFFYTRSLPCTLWFFDKGKPENLKNKVLMIDARNVYHVVSARSRVFTDEQLANLTAIVWLYRGEEQKFVDLVARYHREADAWLAAVPERLAADTAAAEALATPLKAFAEGATLDELNADQPEEAQITPASLEAFTTELSATLADAQCQEAITALLAACSDTRTAIATADLTSHAGQVALQGTLDAWAPRLAGRWTRGDWTSSQQTGMARRMSNDATPQPASWRTTGSSSTSRATHTGWWSRRDTKTRSCSLSGWGHMPNTASKISAGEASDAELQESAMKHQVRVIKTQRDYDEALSRLSFLMDKELAPGSSEEAELELLVVVIEAYERTKISPAIPDPIEAILYRMDQQKLKPKDLEPLIGSVSKVSEVLARKRPLSLKMIRAIHKGLGIPADVLISATGEDDLDLSTEPQYNFSKFPLLEMLERGCFPDFRGGAQQVKEYAEELVRSFLRSAQDHKASSALLRAPLHQSGSRAMDEYALIAWRG